MLAIGTTGSRSLHAVYYNDYRHKEANFNNWDTHQKNFPLLKDNLMPSTDRAFPALLEDLADRGLLDEMASVDFTSVSFGLTVWGVKSS